MLTYLPRYPSCIALTPKSLPFVKYVIFSRRFCQMFWMGIVVSILTYVGLFEPAHGANSKVGSHRY